MLVAAVDYPPRVCANPECRREYKPKPTAHNQRYCSDKCRWRHRDRFDPSAIHNNRLRCARWYGAKGSRPWLLGAPPFEEYLPGGGTEITFEPGIRFEHSQLSALHGVMTSLTGPHTPMFPRFSLVPWHRGCGWGVYFAEDDLAEKLAGYRGKVRLGSGSPTIRLGFLHRLRAPRITRRGHRKLRIDAITPVNVRHSNTDGTSTMHTFPTSCNLHSTLSLMTTRRLGLLVDPDTIKIEMIERQTEPRRVCLAGRSHRLANMRGWLGYCVVDANAVGHWLLEVAARIGLGGTTAFGFGRIVISEV